ncbi:STAS domain-containing protein [Streptomyces liangshanensis]|uniref:Anti-sigma factor antagonist n=1 Tax=Streptomyces liangshanensis TaxID=2717324 RepID=A0A6G9H740_9ACTN|nr:STAS domain-containing protein [Streptomyces liangshanensis]QIQ06353.1 STAS domain-containing protein [Streptomyces liangshanensis]
MSTDDRPVHVAEEPDGRLAVAAVSGDLDAETAPAVYRQAVEVIARCPFVVLDLSDVTFCDSSGFNALLRLRRRAQEDGVELALAALPTQIARLLALTGAEAVFSVHSSVEEARVQLRGTGKT